MNTNRNNPAQQNRWNAWRFPTTEEISRGRDPEDPFWVGADLDKGAASAMLSSHGGGQIQWDVDGAVETIG